MKLFGPQWVACEERLPERGKRVQIILDGRWALGAIDGTGKLWLDELDELRQGSVTGNGRDPHFVSIKSKRVTYWQPIPSVPKEER